MPPQKPSLFISHSTSALEDSHRTVQIRNRTYEALTARGWSPFLDKQALKPGHSWRSTILENLARAQAGIVFFSQEAVTRSKWVSAEALILCFRRSLDPAFQFLPVLLDGMELRDTCFRDYEPFQLNEIQTFSDNTAIPPDEVANRIAAQFDSLRVPQNASSQWISRVNSLLARVELNALRLAAEELEISTEEYIAAGDRSVSSEMLRRALIQLMHHLLPEESLPAFKVLVGELEPRQAAQLSAHLSAKWVANESIETLLCVTRPGATSRLLALNTASQEVVQEYLNRAKIELDRGTVWAFSVAGAPGEGNEIALARVEAAIRESMLGSYDLLDEDNSELPLPDAVEQVMSDEQDVAICTLPPEYGTVPLLELLRQRYPRVVFLAQTRRNTDAQNLLQLVGARHLPPPITPERHNRLIKLKSRIRAAVTATQLQ